MRWSGAPAVSASLAEDSDSGCHGLRAGAWPFRYDRAHPASWNGHINHLRRGHFAP